MMRLLRAGCSPIPDVMADDDASAICSWLSTKSFIFWSIGDISHDTVLPVSSMMSTVWKNLPAFSFPESTSVRLVRNRSVSRPISFSTFASSPAQSGWILRISSRLRFQYASGLWI